MKMLLFPMMNGKEFLLLNKWKSFVALLLILSLFPFAFACAAEKTEGIVRVLLTKLNLTDTMQLSLDGSYTLNGISFQRGSDLTVSCKTGTLMVYYEGMALDAGKKLVFQRHALTEEKENGIRFAGFYELHPGDLHVSMLNGMLQAILHAPVEEYLLGVVPYEMSNTFPVEALKAQAVAARTYALRKAGSSGDYDVVDNTNDQAYMGIKAENEQAAQAVLETKGICGVYKGKMAECYYSASNGGQTELAKHVWGRENFDYLQMYDDPYDVENPESVVMRAKLPKQLNNNQQLGALEAYILDELAEPMEARGFDSVHPFQVKSIDEMTLVSPRYADSPSKMMTQLSMKLTVGGMKYGEEEEEISIFALENPSIYQQQEKEKVDTFYPDQTSVTITLPIFGVVEDALKLSINQTDNEIITISETENAYTLESRRYGHGVGMSQRGAQWMAAQYGWNYQQILNFYYPGMSLKTYTYTNQLPSPVNSIFLATPGPAATPTPRPTPMMLQSTPAPNEQLVSVTNIGITSYLNLRAKDSTASDVLQQLYYGQQLYVMEDLGEWYKVRLDQTVGYVMKEFVEPVIIE